MFLQDFDLTFIHTPGTAMGPADVLSHLSNPDTSSDNTDVTLLPDDLCTCAIDTALLDKITSSSALDPLVINAIQNLSNGSPLFPRSSMTDWHFNGSHLYFKHRLYIPPMLAMISLPQFICPMPLAMEVSSTCTPCYLMTTGGWVCLLLFAVSLLAMPFASK